jgi:hypothetical protein
MKEQGGASIWIGWDPREAAAFALARYSVRRHLTQAIPIRGLILSDLQKAGLYTRPTEITVNGDGRRQLIDVLSKREGYDGRISTEHACSRFLVPHLAKSGWALFMDGDMLVRGNLARMFEKLNPRFAIYCVKHVHEPEQTTKMDGQLQTRYSRKNWSSFMVFNCEHPANRALTVEMVNAVPGRDLHRFCWIDDEEVIGELSPEWNYLVGCSQKVENPKVIHFTLGPPDMAGYDNCEFSDEWRSQQIEWAK